MHTYLSKTTSAAPLAVFRIILGTLLFVSTVRFASKGWIEMLYIRPKFFFPYYGLEFITPLGSYTYLLFVICGLSAIMVALGWYYRIAIVSLFLSFTYIELMDKSTYLNHYYFVSMLCLLMIFLPAHVYFSVDARHKKDLLADKIPLWCIDVLKLFIGMLYFFAGLAKINPDWLLRAYPLSIWLPAKNDTPIIGFLFNKTWVYFAFSWVGCIYDLSIPFLLWYQKTRWFAYIAVVVFHLLTSILFPIGVFPYVMMATALIFFSGGFHQRIIDRLGALFKCSQSFMYPDKTFVPAACSFHFLKFGFIAFFAIQLLLPFRYLLYPGKLFWTEQGYRFSWRVMLMEKSGYAQFKIRDQYGKQLYVDNSQFLTQLQEKMMASQPDMILQYAHFLRDYYIKQGIQGPQVYVDAYVSLNGSMSRLMIDPKTDLALEKESFRHKDWIILYNE